MGLFGPKISKEEKAFNNALKKAVNKPNTGNIEALKAATKAYPAGWQGHWLTALYYDQGFDNKPVDEVKAQEYFLKAESAVKGSPYEDWLAEFLLWYRRDAGNLYKGLTDRLNRMRRMGVAMVRTLQENRNPISGVYEKYGSDGYAMSNILQFVDLMDDEYSMADAGEINAFCECMTVATFDSDTRYKDTSNYLAKITKSVEAYGDCVRAQSSDQQPRWDKVHDMYDYLMGIACLEGGGLFTTAYAAEVGDSEAELGITHLFRAADQGCQPAIHELVRLANASQSNFDLIERLYHTTHRFSNDPFELFLMDCIKKCVEHKDEEAMLLFRMYYAERFTGNH